MLGKRKRFVALGVSASSFHADAATEARGRFTEAAFIKPASRPRYPSGSEQRDREERGPVAGNSSGESWLSWVVKRGKDLEALMTPTARRGARCGQWPCSL